MDSHCVSITGPPVPVRIKCQGHGQHQAECKCPAERLLPWTAAEGMIQNDKIWRHLANSCCSMALLPNRKTCYIILHCTTHSKMKCVQSSSQLSSQTTAKSKTLLRKISKGTRSADREQVRVLHRYSYKGILSSRSWQWHPNFALACAPTKMPTMSIQCIHH